MRPIAVLLAVLLLVPLPQTAFANDVRVCTDRGVIEIDLDERNAPELSRSFLRRVSTGFYSGTIFDRAVADSMVYGGSYSSQLQRRSSDEPPVREMANGLSNRRGTVAAWPDEGTDTTSTRFLINLADNPQLDPTAANSGFTVFARVTSGLEVLDAISRLPTRDINDLSDVPTPTVVLESVTQIRAPGAFETPGSRDPATLNNRFDTARAGNDPVAILGAIEALRSECMRLTPEQHVAEAESAIARQDFDRARYTLTQYLARATALDPMLPQAQRLLARLPQRQRNDVVRRLAHCHRPDAPAIPDGRFSDLATMQSLESEMLRYRQLGRLYLTCISQVIDGGDLTEPELIQATETHNEMVVAMTGQMMRFNAAVRTFRQIAERR